MNPVPPSIWDVTPFYCHILQVRLRHIAVRDLSVGQSKPTVVRVRISALKSQVRSFVDEVSDVMVMPANSSLVWKVSKRELEVIFLALVGGLNVQEGYGYLEVVSFPRSDSPHTVLHVLIRGGEMPGNDFSP